MQQRHATAPQLRAASTGDGLWQRAAPQHHLLLLQQQQHNHVVHRRRIKQQQQQRHCLPPTAVGAPAASRVAARAAAVIAPPSPAEQQQQQELEIVGQGPAATAWCQHEAAAAAGTLLAGECSSVQHEPHITRQQTQQQDEQQQQREQQLDPRNVLREFHKDISRALRPQHCGSVQQLQRVLLRHAPLMDGQGVTAACVAAARLSKQQQQAQQDKHSLQDLVQEQLLPLVVRKLPRLDALGLVLCLDALAALPACQQEPGATAVVHELVRF